jgi:hypothetical protein
MIRQLTPAAHDHSRRGDAQIGGAERAAVPARPAGRGCFRRSRTLPACPHSPARFSQGGPGYARCSWAAAPFITSGRDKYHSYQDEVSAGGVKSTRPTAAAVAWRGFGRGVGFPVACTPRRWPTAVAKGNTVPTPFLANAPTPVYGALRGIPAGRPGLVIGLTAVAVLFFSRRGPGTGGPDEHLPSTARLHHWARRRGGLAACGGGAPLAAPESSRVEAAHAPFNRRPIPCARLPHW